jgi:branched-chain amino acid transport system substrate-binding protein
MLPFSGFQEQHMPKEEQMKRTLISVLALVAVFSLMLSACAPAATEAPPPATTQAPEEQPAGTEAPAAAAEQTAIIGFTASLTGSLNVESTRQKNGLQLWMDQVNNAGGIKLADGSVVKFEAKSYDDESNKDRVQELYTKLVAEDNANFLISPYSSGLADASAVIAEQYEKIMITTGAASDGTYKKGYTLVYQAYTPASHYLTGALDLLASLDANAKKIAIVHENDKFSSDVATALESYATEKGYTIALNEGYDTGTTDFAPIINKIPADVDAVMGGGHFTDGQQFAKAMFDKGITAKFISLLVAPPEPTFSEIGDAALGIVGPSQWEPQAAFTPDYGPTGADFISAYKTAFGEDPSYHAAGGYVAGLILQKAIETAGSLDTQAVKAALDGMDMMTFYGHIKFDTSAESHGLQTGHEMVYIQWQKDSSGALVKQVVWPAEGATAPALYPIR